MTNKKEYRLRHTKGEHDQIKAVRKSKNNNVLVIGDIHAPFEHPGYLEFCKDTYIKYNCKKVVFIGDLIDSHYSSYHETDPDAMGGGQELQLAIGKIQKWYHKKKTSSSAIERRSTTELLMRDVSACMKRTLAKND